jgi:hypothetical protein
MTPGQRTTKQFFIALLFLVIVGGIGFLIYKGVKPVPPVATPNPTINLIPIEVSFRKLFNVENNDYDFLAKVTNPNTDYGSSDVEYKLSFLDSAGKTVSTKTGSFYILPGQTKYVIDSPLKFNQPISNAVFRITSVNWQKLDPLATGGVPLIVRDSSYTQLSMPGTFGKVGGTIYNSSDFDINKVDVAVVLLDQSGQPLAVNKTEISTFLTKTTRGFEIPWPAPFVGQVGSAYAEANANVFESSNFLRKYGGSQQPFQQYY